MHLTLLQDAATPPAKTLREQLDRFRAFQRLYNDERPHQALGDATRRTIIKSRSGAGTASCASLTIRSTTRCGAYAPTARSNGGPPRLRQLRARRRAVSLAGNSAAGWAVSFGPVALGVIAHGDDRLRKPKSASCGLVDNPAGCPQGPQPPQPQHQT